MRMADRLAVVLLAVASFYFGAIGVASAAPTTKFELRLELGQCSFDPSSDLDLNRLELAVEALLQKSALAPKDSKASSHAHPERSHRGLQELQRLIGAVRASSSEPQRSECVALLLETVAALNNDQRPPIPAKVDFLEMPWLFLRQTHRPVGTGRTPATNLAPGPYPDLSCLDPLPSTFWHRPSGISAIDVYHGFGRTSWLHLENVVCDYSAPKKSLGLNPGFDVSAEGVSIKVKFAEVSSEAFLTRIFDALGYHADPTDYAREVRVRYDRRLLQEFYSRMDR
jgi:hypothetical protein